MILIIDLKNTNMQSSIDAITQNRWCNLKIRQRRSALQMRRAERRNVVVVVVVAIVSKYWKSIVSHRFERNNRPSSYVRLQNLLKLV